ncbi:YybH family protein [Lysobacter xanthus]
MRRLATALIPAVLAAATAPVIAGEAPAQGVGRPAAAPFSADECAVFARELSFARSVAEHDSAAFAEHVAPDAAFAVGSPRPQRGRDAIVRGWGEIVRGEGIRLEWYPVRTTAVGDIAWSTGPALSETTENGTTVYRRGTFQSVWRRGADGTWQVVFDGGTPPQTVDAEAAAAFRKARPVACPGA